MTNIGFRRVGISSARVGMIDREQFLAAVAHLSLGGEEVFRSGFVAHFGVGGDIAEAIKRSGPGTGESAYQTATFSRRSFTSMSDHCLEMFAAKL